METVLTEKTAGGKPLMLKYVLASKSKQHLHSLLVVILIHLPH